MNTSDQSGVAVSERTGPESPPSLGRRWHNGLVAHIRRWVERTEDRQTDRRCGGNQRCPWCHQWVNHFIATRVQAMPDGFTDAIHCGNCGGSSLWTWELGFFYLGRLAPPADQPSPYADREFVALRVKAALMTAHREAG